MRVKSTAPPKSLNMTNMAGGPMAASIIDEEKQRSVKYLLHAAFGLNYTEKK